jgi:hypothetical protein
MGLSLLFGVVGLFTGGGSVCCEGHHQRVVGHHPFVNFGQRGLLLRRRRKHSKGGAGVL